MKEIFKYQLEIKEEQILDLPVGYQILTAQMQCGDLCLWVIVDPNGIEHKNVLIEIIGTGHPMDKADRTYISTVQMYGGGLVLHIFEKY